MEDWKIELLQRLYNEPDSAAAFAGVDQLWYEAREIDKRIRKKDVLEFLSGHRTYTLHKPRRVHFQRARTIPSGYLSDVQADLADFQYYSRWNQGYKYALLAIDVLSKRIFVRPLRSKKPNDVIEAFEGIFSEMEMLPHRVFTDKGLEFTGKSVTEYFERKDIEKHKANASTGPKASLAERAIRNFKQRIFRYMSEKSTKNWVDVAERIANGINNSRSRALGGLRPIDISFENAQEVWEANYGPRERYMHRQRGKSPRFKVGDTVRLSRDKGPFHKGYMPNYHDNIVTIDSISRAYGLPRYKLRDEHGETYKGYFYEPELTGVRKHEGMTYRIEKRIRTKRDKETGKKMRLVKFIDDPAHYWIPANDNDDL